MKHAACSLPLSFRWRIAMLLSLAGLCANATAQVTGPSTATAPYLTPFAGNPYSVTSILTAGDTVPGIGGGSYQMVGIPDGLGAVDNGNGTFTVYMNHELSAGSGGVRAHGASGAFVSMWVIDKATLQVTGGADLIQQVATWNAAGGSYNAPATGVSMARFCAADLPAVTAFYNAGSGLGTTERIFLNGEETSASGRAFAHVLTGTDAGISYELPHVGRASFENVVANPFAQDKTIVVGLDDSTPGQVYVYVGNKASTGSVVERAGLVGGSLYGVTVAGMATEPNLSPPTSAAFSLSAVGAVAGLSYAQVETASDTAGVTEFLRAEDGVWDPSHPEDFYFISTAGNSGAGRLWRLRFSDITQPENGGSLSLLLDGTEGALGLDNIGFGPDGNLWLQEDPPSSSRLARVWRYILGTDQLEAAFQATPGFFSGGSAISTGEETTGVVDVSSILGGPYLLAAVQSHESQPGAIVQGGQLMLLAVPESGVVWPIVGLVGLGVAVRMRRGVERSGLPPAGSRQRKA